MAAITDLAAASSVAGPDQLVINQGGTDRRVTADKFAILSAANVFSQVQIIPRIRSLSLGGIADDGVCRDDGGCVVRLFWECRRRLRNALPDARWNAV